MVLGKNYRLSIRRNIITSPTTGHRSEKVTFLLEHRTNKESALLFEKGTIVTLTSDDIESIKTTPIPSGTTSSGFKLFNECYGILGILSINANFSSSSSFNSLTSMASGHATTVDASVPPIQYLVLITGIYSVGKILDQEVFRIQDTAFISLRGIPSDGDKIKEIRNILNSQTFYFSCPLSMTSAIKTSSSSCEVPFDITICCQRMVKTLTTPTTSRDFGSSSSESDNRFFWNKTLYLPFIRSNIDTNEWLIKVICGSIAIQTVYVGAKQVKAALISRLSKERTGTRFNVRGVNDDGSVANFVETEQIINYDNYLSSYVMIRGSVPLFWSQPGVNVGSHKVKLTRGSEITQPCYDKHVASLIKRYGSQHFITLCGHKEGEANLTRMYRAHHKVFISKFEQIPLTIFDNHANCPKGKEDNLTIKLLLEIQSNLSNFGFFAANLKDNFDGKAKVINSQTGVFRVNCIDCLDRTNRVQTFIGLNLIESQLEAIGLLDKDKEKTIQKCRQSLESLWPLNGDNVSRIYSGTGALEGKSKLKDSTLSVARTIQNNLLDSSKQEAIDVLLFGKSLSARYIEKCRNMLTVNQISHLDPGILINVCNRYKEYTSSQPIKVVVSTYNVAGGKNFMYKTSIPLSDWLLDYKIKGIGIKRSPDGSKLIPTNPSNNVPNIMDMSLNDPTLASQDDDYPDIYAIGFEEIVDLNAGNIVAASTSNQREWLIEIQKVISSATPYVLITSVQLVGVCLYIFIRPHHAKYIRDVSTDTVKTGLGGAAGNKGGVAVKFTFHSTSLCFICSHFAAGQSGVHERNADYNEISKKLAFSSLTCGETSSLNCLDYIFWCGDFNYRINLDNETTRQLVSVGDIETLKLHDQLIISKKEGKCFHDFNEGDIQFNPTYKYDTNSDDYDTSEKQRVPAWTDRILYKKNTFIDEDAFGDANSFDDANYGKLNFYGRSELKTSDHRPVIAEFVVQILKVDPEKRKNTLLDAINNFGPPDATILIHIKDVNHVDVDADELTDAFVSDVIDFVSSSASVEILASRKIDRTNIISVTLKNGQQTLTCLNSLNGSVYNGTHLDIRLATPNYVEQTMNQLNDLDNNCVPLTDAIDMNGVERIEKEADADIGPVVDPRIFCVVDVDDDLNVDGHSSSSGRSSPSFFDKSPSDFDPRTPISSCHTSPVHQHQKAPPTRPPGPSSSTNVPGRPPPPPPAVSAVSIGVTLASDQPSKLVPARAAPPPPVKPKIVHQQALNPPTIMKTAPSTDSSFEGKSSFETETPPSSANPLKTKPPPIPKSPDPVKEATSVWDSPPVQPKHPAPPSVPVPPVPKDAPVKVVPSKPGFADLFASDSVEDEEEDGGANVSVDPFNETKDSSNFGAADSSFNVSAPSIPPPPPPEDVDDTSFGPPSDWTDSSCDLNESGPPPPMVAPPPPPVPSSPTPDIVPNGGTINRRPPPTIPSRGPPPPIVPPRRGV